MLSEVYLCPFLFKQNKVMRQLKLLKGRKQGSMVD